MDEGEGIALHRCAPYRPVPVGTHVPRAPWGTIDVHCHILVPEVEKLVSDHPVRLKEVARELEALGRASQDFNSKQFQSLLPKLTTVGERLEDMGRMGVDVQVVSPAPTQYHYWADQELSDVLTDLSNNQISKLCEADPDRFWGLGTVSLQTPERAAAQLEVLMRDRGFKGVEISTLVNGMDISDRFFDPFWAKAEALGAVIFIHPWGTTMGSRLADQYLLNTVGQPLETTICLSKIIFGGTLDKFPKLRILAAHGGGYLPLYGGRSNHAHAIRPDAQGCLCQPTDYLRRIWFDTVVHDPDQLRWLVERVGIDQVVTGSDYPFDMGEYDPSGLVQAFTPDEQSKILGRNAEALFNSRINRRIPASATGQYLLPS